MWEWAIIFIGTIIYILYCELWKWVKRIYRRRQAKKAAEAHGGDAHLATNDIFKSYIASPTQTSPAQDARSLAADGRVYEGHKGRRARARPAGGHTPPAGPAKGLVRVSSTSRWAASITASQQCSAWHANGKATRTCINNPLLSPRVVFARLFRIAGLASSLDPLLSLPPFPLFTQQARCTLIA